MLIFESFLKGIKSNERKNNTSFTEKCQNHFSRSFAYKVVCIDDRFSNNVALYRQKIQPKNLTKQFLKNMKKINNKNLVMSAEDEAKFQSSNKC